MKEKSAQRLLVFIPPRRALTAAGKGQLSSSTVVSYVAFGLGSAKSQIGETPIALLPKSAHVDIVFDTADVFVAAIDAPKLSEVKLRQALPNLLEERLLAEPNDCHFAFKPPTPRGGGNTTVAEAPKLPVAVVDRGLLTRVLDAMTETGYRPRAAYGEIYTVPAPIAGVLAVRADRGRGIARSGKHDGFAFDLDGGTPPALALAVRQLGVKQIKVYGRDAEKLQKLAGPLGIEVQVTQREVDLNSTEGAVNLLQGAFAQGGMFGGFSPRALTGETVRAPLIWLGIAAVTFAAGMNIYYQKLRIESSAIRGNMDAAFRSAFPDATVVVDPVLQAKRNMNALRSRAGVASPDDFSVLNAQAAQLLSTTPLGAVAGVEYRDGALKVKFKPGVGDNPGLQNALRAQAPSQGLNLRFEPDGSARLSPSGQ